MSSYPPTTPVYPPYVWGGPPLPTLVKSTIDHTAFLHIIDSIVEHADRRSLLALRATSREFRARADKRLFSTALMRRVTCTHLEPVIQIYSGDGWRLPHMIAPYNVYTQYNPLSAWARKEDARVDGHVANTKVLEYDTTAMPTNAVAKFFPNLDIVRIQCHATANTAIDSRLLPPIYEFLAPTVVVMGQVCPPVERNPSGLFEVSSRVPPQVTTVVLHPTADTHGELLINSFDWNNVTKLVIVFTSLAELVCPLAAVADGSASNIANAVAMIESARAGGREIDVTVVDLEEALRRLLSLGFAVTYQRNLEYGVLMTKALTLDQLLDPTEWGWTARFLRAALCLLAGFIGREEIKLVSAEQYAASMSHEEAKGHLQWTWAPRFDCNCHSKGA
ncbi:uncharacterized protein LOC62_03G003916 [Vanrija pseudolonga]|uniref:F-box domain-containing protein n=1 Tax=Vanrija pseudolonga TaxID=143232 RepID=A0AAF1BL52_9TREE|nr:hypothetical protein LOC62_03G003916 [Vanrija pseudolonga]